MLTVFALVPAGILVGFLYGDPANGELDTALAWGSLSELLTALAFGVWLSLLPGTAIYFERTNSRYRSQLTDSGSSDGLGLGLAITALVLGAFLAGPLVFLPDYFAWRRISATGIRYARGAATAAVAACTGVIGLIYWIVSALGAGV